MPNWKKVIVSGSDAVLNTVTASAGFFGTASWATNSTTASYVLNAVSSSFATSASRAAQAGNTSTIDVNIFSSPVDSYILMSNVAGTAGVAIGGDADLRYNSSTNVLTVGNISATTLTGSLLGTASNAVNAISSSFASTSSFVQNAVSSSFASTASFASTVPASGVIGLNLSQIATGSVTASVSLTQFTVTSGSSTELRVTGNGVTLGNIITDAHTITGSLNVSGSITSSLFGTASWASSASQAITASYILNAVSSSFASTASFVQNAVSSSFASTASFVVTAQTASYILNAVSSSFASTASFVNTLNQNVLITGSLTVGATTAGASENTLTLGPRGTNEGGQLGFQAGTSATSASMLDMYQDGVNPYFRLLRGSNATSDAVVAQWNTHTKQMFMPTYNSPTAFTGTTLVGLLGFDANGAIITTSTGSGGGGVTITNNTDNYILTATGVANTINGESGLQFNGSSLTVTGQITSSGAIISQANGAMYFRGGDDAEFWDINVVNTVGIYGQQDQGVASVKLGSGGGTVSGRSGSIGINTTTPNSGALHVSGGVFATSFTGSFTGSLVGALTGTASFADRATSASRADTASFLNVGTYAITSSWAVSASQAITASYVLNAVSSSFASTASFAPNYVLTSATASMLSPYVLTSQTSSMSVATASLALRASGSLTGSLLGTASWATNAITAANATNVSITGDNSGTAFTLPLILGTTGTGQTLYVDSTPAVLYTPNINQLWASNLQATGSLFGTASWATNAITANTASYVLNAVSSSFASTASFIATASWADRVVSASGNNSTIQYNSSGRLAGSSRFQFNGSDVQFGDGGNRVFGITGSLSVTGSSVITGSLIVSDASGGIDTSAGRLSWNNGSGILTKVDWANGGLNTGAGINTVDWENLRLNDSSAGVSIDWNARQLATPAGNSFRWDNDYFTFSNIYHTSVISTGIQNDFIDNASPPFAGQIIRGTVDGATTTGQSVYLDSDGTWYPVKNIVTGATRMLGICVDQATGQVLIEGDVGVSDNNTFGTYVIGADHGLPVYLSGTNGVLDVTQPTNGVVRTVGHIYYQSTTTANYWLMKFRPSNDWYEQ